MTSGPSTSAPPEERLDADFRRICAGSGPALRLGPFVEFHRKRPFIAATDLLRFTALGSVPIVATLDLLAFARLGAVGMVATACDPTFTAAGTAHRFAGVNKRRVGVLRREQATGRRAAV